MREYCLQNKEVKEELAQSCQMVTRADTMPMKYSTLSSQSAYHLEIISAHTTYVCTTTDEKAYDKGG